MRDGKKKREVQMSFYNTEKQRLKFTFHCARFEHPSTRASNSVERFYSLLFSYFLPYGR